MFSCMIADALHEREKFFSEALSFSFVIGERMIPSVLSTGVSRLGERGSCEKVQINVTLSHRNE